MKHTSEHSPLHRIHVESGVYIPLTAMVISTLVVSVLVFGYDSVRISRMRTTLGKVTHDVCYQVTAHSVPVLQKQVAKQFRAALYYVSRDGESMLQEASLKKARLSIPTLGGLSLGEDVDFRSLGIGRCSSRWAPDLECYFTGRVTGGSFRARFPGDLWQQGDDLGNTVSCELEIEFDTLFSGKQTMRSVAVEYLPPRDANDGTGGLAIVVAPQMTTFHTERPATTGSRFQFRYNTRDRRPIDYVFSQVDPLPLTDQFTGFSEGDLGGNPNGLLYGALGNHVPLGTGASDLEIHPFTHFEGTDCEKFHTPRECAAAIQRQREELAVACMNPAVLVRNLFVQSIIELSQRHGELLSNTRVLLANSQRTRFGAGLVTRPHSRCSMKPTVLVSGGSGLLQRRYEIPFLPTLQCDSPDTRWFDPFRTSPFLAAAATAAAVPDPVAEEDALARFSHESIVVNQLRFCRHLYDGHIKRFPASGISSFDAQDWIPKAAALDSISPVNEANLDFEDSLIFLPREVLYPGFSTGDAWANEKVWGNSSDSLNASELVSILGTAQWCPFEGIGSPCQKRDLDKKRPAAEASSELYPDLTAALDYFYLDTVNLKAGREAPTAFKGPGLFPINQPGAGVDCGDTYSGPVPYGPLPENLFYETNTNSRSHILFVLHQPPHAIQVSRIKNQVKHLVENEGYEISVAYFPTRAEDASKDAMDRLYSAFHLGDMSSGQKLMFGAPIIVFSPYKQDSRSIDLPFGPSLALEEWEQFANYWRNLLDVFENQNGNVTQEAKRLFQSRILNRMVVM